MVNRLLSKKRVMTVIGITAFVGAAAFAMQFRPSTSAPNGGHGEDVVVLLHGLARTSASMSILAGRLADDGYRVENFGYGSFGDTIDGHAAALVQFIDQLESDESVNTIHYVGHSLGNIIIRAALVEDPPSKPGRIVMLAPPNRGSADAAFWTPLLGDVVKPLQELSDEQTSFVNQLPVPQGIDIGIIAAADDGRVELDDTHLDGEADHVVVPGIHTFIVMREDVAKHVDHFLRHGSFER